MIDASRTLEDLTRVMNDVGVVVIVDDFDTVLAKLARKVNGTDGKEYSSSG